MLLLPSTSCVQAVVLKLSPVSNKAAPMRYVIQSFECSDIMLSLLSPKSIWRNYGIVTTWVDTFVMAVTAVWNQWFQVGFWITGILHGIRSAISPNSYWTLYGSNRSSNLQVWPRTCTVRPKSCSVSEWVFHSALVQYYIIEVILIT